MIRLFKHFAWVSVVLLVGCQQDGPSITGIITLDGVPLSNAQLMFKPEGEADSKTIAMATSDAAGQFSLTSLGIPDGNYRILVFKMMELGAAGNVDGNELLIPVPEIYSDEATSPLVVELPAKTEVRLELKNEN